MTKIADDCGLLVYLHLDFEKVVKIFESETARDKGRGYGHSRWKDRYTCALLGLGNVHSVCLNHQAWVAIEPKARTYEGAAAEVERTRAKIDRITERYMKLP